MHKNSYNPKVLNGNWFENRFTDGYDMLANQTSNTHLPNPSFDKYVSTAKAIGNKPAYQKVSLSPFKDHFDCSKTLEMRHRISLISRHRSLKMKHLRLRSRRVMMRWTDAVRNSKLVRISSPKTPKL